MMIHLPLYHTGLVLLPQMMPYQTTSIFLNKALIYSSICASTGNSMLTWREEAILFKQISFGLQSGGAAPHLFFSISCNLLWRMMKTTD